MTKNTIKSSFFVYFIFIIIYIISNIKYKYTRSTLFYNDVFEFDRFVFRDIFKTQPLILIAPVIILLAGVSIFVLWDKFLYSAYIGFRLNFALLLFAIGLYYLTRKRAVKDLQTWNIDSRHTSTFLVQMIEQRFMRQNFRKLFIAPALPVDFKPFTETVARAPHIILIMQEATMPPSLYGMSENDEMRKFFKGSEQPRALKVDIFGGQTIISIMSAFTGLPSKLFGDYRSYVPRIFLNKIHISLPFFLRQHGYETTCFVSADGDWMGVGPFYKSLGFQEVVEPYTFTNGQHSMLMHKRDAIIYGAAFEDIDRKLQMGANRTFTAIETLFNHAPHTKKISSQVQFNFDDTYYSHIASYDDEAYEYIKRMNICISDYKDFKRALSDKYPKEKFLLVHYGDHQPVLVNQLAGNQKEKHFTTYYAVDWAGDDDGIVEGGFCPENLPVHDIDLIIADRAGLPLNGFQLAKRELYNDGAVNVTGVESLGMSKIVARLSKDGLIDTQ